MLHADGRTLFLPFALPGERVRAHTSGRQAAVLEALLDASPDRATPPCALFGRCGGCALQHMRTEAMQDFKRALVGDTLGQLGFALPREVGFFGTAPGTRRRMDLALRRLTERVLIGLHWRGALGSDASGDGARDIVDMTECHVLEPRLLSLVAALRPLLLRLGCLRATGSLVVNLLDSGPDLLLATDAPPDTADRSRLAAFAASAAIPRIAWRPLKGGNPEPEIVCSTAPVHHDLSGARICPPPGAFLQASRDGEAAIVGAVLAGLPASMPRGARITELYSGCGTLSFALATRGKLQAFEGHKASAACLLRAAPGMRIEARQRDLARQPLLAAELGRAAVVVLDPPFGGTGPQMGEIARSGVPRVIMVSCNPRVLRQDAALLHAAGYALAQLTVVDQFLWSGGVESVAVFVKPGRRSATTP